MEISECDKNNGNPNLILIDLKVAIAILNWNGKNWLEKFLPNVITHSQNADIYVIDNASTDDSINFIQSYFPDVHIIQNASNSGFAGGYNEGLKKSMQKFIAF